MADVGYSPKDSSSDPRTSGWVSDANSPATTLAGIPTSASRCTSRVRSVWSAPGGVWIADRRVDVQQLEGHDRVGRRHRVGVAGPWAGSVHSRRNASPWQHAWPAGRRPDAWRRPPAWRTAAPAGSEIRLRPWLGTQQPLSSSESSRRYVASAAAAMWRCWETYWGWGSSGGWGVDPMKNSRKGATNRGPTGDRFSIQLAAWTGLPVTSFRGQMALAVPLPVFGKMRANTKAAARISPWTVDSVNTGHSDDAIGPDAGPNSSATTRTTSGGEIRMAVRIRSKSSVSRRGEENA